jgi:signal transduction histidine kinase
METPKRSVERQQTDESLREERAKTDEAIAEGRDLVQESADEVLRRARDEADAVLEGARRKADQLLKESAGTLSANAAVAMEREFEDAAVRADRETADQTLELERVETARILARLLPLEREQTDDRLHAERVQADGALANRDDFLGVVAHDLRDLVGGIVMSSSVIAALCRDTEHAARVGAEVTRIRRHAVRANRLIGDLVDVASIDAGRLSIVKAPGDVQVLLAEASDEFRPSAAVKGIDLSVENRRGALLAEFDHARLLQVVGNLIVNAIKFSPRHGRIILRAERVGDHMQCSVVDTGPGIPNDQLEQVFERFVQVDGDDRRGLGLGLFIAKQIIEGHSGRIWAESTLGQGTSVLFTIPIHT